MSTEPSQMLNAWKTPCIREISNETVGLDLYLRGQDIRLQALDSIAAPRPIEAQSRPPLDGAGLLQVRYLCISPPPHVTSHWDQSLHGVYPPSSADTNHKNVRKNFVKIVLAPPWAVLEQKTIRMFLLGKSYQPWCVNVKSKLVHSCDASIKCSTSCIPFEVRKVSLPFFVPRGLKMLRNYLDNSSERRSVV